MLKKLFSKFQTRKKTTRERRIVQRVNELINEINNQGYRLKDHSGNGALFIFLHADGSIAVENSECGIRVEGIQEVAK